MPEVQAPTRYRVVIAGLIAFVAFSGTLSMFSTGPITPIIISKYGVSNSTAGLLTSIIFLVHVVLAIPISMLIGRIGLKTMITLAAVASSTPLLTFVAADSFVLLLAIRIIYGIGFVLFLPALGPLMMQWFHPKELPLVNGGILVMCSIGIAVSSLIIMPLVEVIGWEIVLSGFGAVSALSAITWAIFGKAERITPINTSHSSLERIWIILRNRNTLLVAIADAGPLTLLTVCMGWLPTYYYEAYGMSLVEGSSLTGFLSLAGVASIAMASLITGRTRKRRPFLIIPGILTGFAGIAVLVLPNSAALYIAVAVLGFACWFYLPALMTIPMDLYPNDPNKVAITYSTLISIGGIASFIGPPSIGAIADLTGSLVPGLVAFAVLSWSLVIAGMLLPSTVTIKSNSVR